MAHSKCAKWHIQNVLVAHSKSATSRSSTKCAQNEFYPDSLSGFVVTSEIICLVLALWGKSKQTFGKSFIFGNWVCTNISLHEQEQVLNSATLDVSCSWFFWMQDLIFIRLWNWNFDKRHGLFRVRRGIHKKSKPCLNFTLYLFWSKYSVLVYQYQRQLIQ